MINTLCVIFIIFFYCIYAECIYVMHVRKIKAYRIVKHEQN